MVDGRVKADELTVLQRLLGMFYGDDPGANGKIPRAYKAVFGGVATGLFITEGVQLGFHRHKGNMIEFTAPGGFRHHVTKQEARELAMHLAKAAHLVDTYEMLDEEDKANG